MNYSSKFIIIKHEADKAGLHQDFRFKLPGGKGWDSYAVRKGVATEVGKKVLAVKTTIHTEKEATFTGVIKSGYGAGKLTKVDGGSCTILKISPRHIALDLKGSKFKGLYHLVSTGVIDKEYNKGSFLLFKGKEDLKK